MTRLRHVELTNPFGKVSTLDYLLNSACAVGSRRVGLGRETSGEGSPFCGMGKSATSRIKIPVRTVSETHALIEYDSSLDRMVVIDLDSTNGTKVQRYRQIVPVNPSERFSLVDGDVIGLGPEYHFKYHEVRK